MTHTPLLLGEKLAPALPVTTGHGKFRRWMLRTVFTTLNFLLLGAMAGIPIWWLFTQPAMDRNAMLTMVAAAAGLWVLLCLRKRTFYPRVKGVERPEFHPLLANDRQGFMKALRLDTKTAVFDGSNIYHFGHVNDLDAQPLGMIANQLRIEGYRILCFFDANIFYTLAEHGAFQNDQRHSTQMLQDIFGLEVNEIYVVPSGIQADKYILDCLKHLPISFAISNDRFRDYAKRYPTVMKGDQWRKGVALSKNEIKLTGHKFQAPVCLS